MTHTAQPCKHPADRLYSWHAYDGTLCVACCDCGEPLSGKVIDLAPATNTEARQQAELDAEQPETHADNCACDACRNAFFDDLDSQLDKRIARLRTAAQLFDPIATLPLFSGTAPRGARSRPL